MHEDVKAGLTFLSFNLLAKDMDVVQAITSRTGGISLPPFESLNLGLGVGDSWERVATNYQLVSRALGLEIDSLTTCKQVHGDRVIKITSKIKDLAPFVYYHQ